MKIDGSKGTTKGGLGFAFFCCLMFYFESTKEDPNISIQMALLAGASSATGIVLELDK